MLGPGCLIGVQGQHRIDAKPRKGFGIDGGFGPGDADNRLRALGPQRSHLLRGDLALFRRADLGMGVYPRIFKREEPDCLACALHNLLQAIGDAVAAPAC